MGHGVHDRNTTPWLHSEGVVNGIRLHWVEAGRREHPLIVMLHGFPEFWYSWHNQLPALAKAGYRVVAPDMRGYNLSEKPVRGYDLNTLSQDCADLISLLTDRKAILVGHDWGGIVAWATAARFPNLIEKLVILNAPHMSKLATEYLSFTQTLKFWYIGFIQFPWLPELIWGTNRAWLLSMMLKDSRGGPFDESTAELYRDAVSQPGALKCMLSYYRHMKTSSLQSLRYDKIKAPVLLMWGSHDPYLGEELIDNIETWVTGRLERVVLDCGHWMPLERPDEVNRHILLFLGAPVRIDPLS